MDELKDLVIKAQNGDISVYEELYERTKSKAYYIALQLLKNPQDAEDVLQDAYTTAFSKIDDAVPEKFQGWLDTIVINRAKDVLKKKKPMTFSALQSEDGTEYIPEDKEERIEFLPAENMDYQETKRLIQEIIDELPEEQRMTIMLYYYKEMSVGQIAEYFECSTGTIKSRLNYARKTIKTKVYELEKKGTKLYSIPVLPFLYWMFQSEAEEAAFTSANVLQHVLEGFASKQATGTAIHTSIDIVAKDIAGNGAKKFLGGKVASMSVGMKIGITTVVATVGITGGIITFNSLTNNIPDNNNVVTTEVKGIESPEPSDLDENVNVTDGMDEAKTEEKSTEEINQEAKIAYAKKIPSIFKYLADVCDTYFSIDDINGDNINECIVFADDYREFSIYGGAEKINAVPYTQMLYIMTYDKGNVVDVLDGSQEALKWIIDKDRGYISCDFSMSGLDGGSYYTLEEGALKWIKSFSYIDGNYTIDEKKVSEQEYNNEYYNYFRQVSEMEEMVFYKVSEESVNKICGEE